MLKPKSDMIYRERGRDPLTKTWHATDAVTALLVHSGSGCIVCSERSYPFSPGTLCLIGRGKYHYTVPDEPSCYERSKMFVSAQTLERLLSLFPNEKIHRMKDKTFVYSSLPEVAAAEAEKIFARLAACDEAYREVIFASELLRLLVLLDRFSSADVTATQGTVSRAIEYINRNIAGEITVDEICKALHISKYYFCRKFKKSTTMTVMNYILKTRITLAKDMLASGDLSVTEIGMKCGFSSASYFCRVFKEDTGVSPLQFKNYASSRGEE